MEPHDPGGGSQISGRLKSCTSRIIAAMPTRRRFLTTVPAVLAAAQVSPPACRRSSSGSAGAAWLTPYQRDVQRLVDASIGTTAAWDRLAELCDTFGGRLTGSRNLQLACEWAAETMRGDGLENVRLEKTMAPHWVRGEESLAIETPGPVAPGHAGARRQRGHARRRHHRAADRGPQVRRTEQAVLRGARAHRPVRRAVHELRPDGRAIAPTARSTPPVMAPWPCSCARSARSACARPTRAP